MADESAAVRTATHEAASLAAAKAAAEERKAARPVAADAAAAGGGGGAGSGGGGVAPSRQVIVLHTTSPSTSHVDACQRKLVDLLNALHVHARLVDGADAANKELRAQLWAVPHAARAVYPFVFVASSDASGAVAYSAIGDFETVMAMHEGAAHKQVEHTEGDLARRLEGCA